MARTCFVVATAVSMLMVLCIVLLFPSAANGELDMSYYDYSCPAVEDIVRSIIEDAVSQHDGLAPGLLRLHFHDCFVQGCDASVLLDSIPNSGTLAEKDHPANIMSLRGMDVIDYIKDTLEQECPQTVSCADILAFAARDAVNIGAHLTPSLVWLGAIDCKPRVPSTVTAPSKMGGPSWPVPGGRLDGLVSLAEEAGANLASPTFDLHQLTQSFASKGLSQEDMITLSGAHTIGDSHCNSFQERLFDFNQTHPQDPRLDARLAISLQSRCDKNVNGQEQVVVGMDIRSPRWFDVSYYVGLQEGHGLFQSDVALLSNPSTSQFVSKIAKDQTFWFDNFADAMFRMSQIDVKTYNDNYKNSNGEIRVNCHVINY